MAKWKNEVALVTGASSGIGWAVALALGRAGMRVAVTGRRKERLDELVDLLNESEAEGLAVPADFSREEDIAKCLSRSATSGAVFVSLLITQDWVIKRS